MKDSVNNDTITKRGKRANEKEHSEHSIWCAGPDQRRKTESECLLATAHG